MPARLGTERSVGSDGSHAAKHPALIRGFPWSAAGDVKGQLSLRATLAAEPLSIPTHHRTWADQMGTTALAVASSSTLRESALQARPKRPIGDCRVLNADGESTCKSAEPGFQTGRHLQSHACQASPDTCMRSVLLRAIVPLLIGLTCASIACPSRLAPFRCRRLRLANLAASLRLGGCRRTTAASLRLRDIGGPI